MNYYDRVYKLVSLTVDDQELSNDLQQDLEDLAAFISGDWGGSIEESRAIILTAFKLGQLHK